MKYIQDFVEKPHPVFNNLSVCPFARKARLEGRIRIEVCDLSQDVLSICRSFSPTDHDIMIVMHPDKTGVDKDDLELLAALVSTELGYEVFTGHPEHDFRIGDLYTRREPYPNLQLVAPGLLAAAVAGLKKTGYYANWTTADLEYVSGK